MRIGFGAPVSGIWATPDNLAGFAASAEAAGYASLWTFQRLLVPEGSAMDPVYHSVLDPMVALGFLAGATQRIRLGVAVTNMPYLAPSYLAKMAATVDVLSRGRLDLGLGIGWMPEEFTAADATTAHRGARTAEYLEVLRRAWADGVTEFSGRFYQVPPGRMAPKPVQRPGPPILLAGGVPAALQRAGRLADGWVTASRTGPVPDRGWDRAGPGGGRGGRPGPGRDPDRVPRRGPARGAGDRAGGRRPAAAVRQLRRHPRGRGLAGQPGRHRAVLRPELGSADRLPHRRPGRRGWPGPRRSSPNWPPAASPPAFPDRVAESFTRS